MAEKSEELCQIEMSVENIVEAIHKVVVVNCQDPVYSPKTSQRTEVQLKSAALTAASKTGDMKYANC